MPNRRVQQMSEAKLVKLEEKSRELEKQLNVKRIPVSEASKSLIEYCEKTRDPLIPSVWGPIDKKDDPFAPTSSASGCCVVM